LRWREFIVKIVFVGLKTSNAIPGGGVRESDDAALERIIRSYNGRQIEIKVSERTVHGKKVRFLRNKGVSRSPVWP
jgi:hypothetical protein